MTPNGPPIRKIFHAVDSTMQHHENRILFAQESWDQLYAQGVIPCHCFEVQRTAKEIGDKRELPYLKDILKFAMDQAADDDIILWTNGDIWLHPSIVGYLKFHVATYGACTGQRVDYRNRIQPKQTVELLARMGIRHMGRDLVAGTKRWFTEKWEQIGDPIIGASDFDLHLTCIVRLDYGIQTSRKNIEQILHPAEIPLGYVVHQHHQPAWSHPKNVNVAPSQVHNRLGFRQWSEVYLPSLKFNAHNCI